MPTLSPALRLAAAAAARHHQEIEEGCARASNQIAICSHFAPGPTQPFPADAVCCAAGYVSDPAITRLLESYEWIIVPGPDKCSLPVRLLLWVDALPERQLALIALRSSLLARLLLNPVVHG